MNAVKVRTPIQILLNIDEMTDDESWDCLSVWDLPFFCECWKASIEGCKNGLIFALEHTQEEIDLELQFVRDSYDNTVADSAKSGWDRAILWSAGRIEWDAEGNVVEPPDVEASQNARQ